MDHPKGFVTENKFRISPKEHRKKLRDEKKKTELEDMENRINK